MSAVRRVLLIISLSLAATALLAQSDAPAPSKSKSKKPPVAAPAPEPEPAQPEPEVVRKPTEPVTAVTDSDVTNARVYRLSLAEALKNTVERNLGIQLQRYDYQQAGYSLRSNYGIFDWLTTADIERQSLQSPPSSASQASSRRATIANFGLQQNLPTGGAYSVGFNNSRAATAGGFTTVSPAYTTNLTLGLTQPLLRNFGIDVTRRNINLARNTLGISREAFRAVLIGAAVTAEQAYLDLVYARQNVEVVKEAVFLARDQARITQIRIDVGASAPLDILQPNVQIATTEEQLISAVAAVRDAEDRLRQVMHLDPSDWDRPIVPVDPIDYKPLPVDSQQSVSRAFDLRPEVREQHLGIDSKRIAWLFAKNQTLPKLDLSLSYGAAGLAGTFFDPVTGQPTGVSTAYPHALGQSLASDFPSWTVAVNVGIPVLNIGAKAEAKRAELDYRSSRTSEDNIREQIAIDVRHAVRAIDTAAKQIAQTKTAREAAEKNLDAEKKRFENGMTTNFNVLQIQQQLSDARVAELQALVGYNKAVADYHRAVGDLLDIRNISVDESDRIDEPQFFTRFDRYNWLYYANRFHVDDPVAGGAPKEEPKK
ncbi:MAG TPA: TolC family protein [Thermoanaerobaculia bacterium]|nr:TolC family protein [Thermoanaerobaculia bacterium]